MSRRKGIANVVGPWVKEKKEEKDLPDTFEFTCSCCGWRTVASLERNCHDIKSDLERIRKRLYCWPCAVKKADQLAKALGDIRDRIEKEVVKD